MTTENITLLSHTILILMSGVGLALLARTKKTLDRYCTMLERHAQALEDFSSALKRK
jgi:hypothetical protein